MILKQNPSLWIAFLLYYLNIYLMYLMIISKNKYISVSWMVLLFIVLFNLMVIKIYINKLNVLLFLLYYLNIV